MNGKTVKHLRSWALRELRGKPLTRAAFRRIKKVYNNTPRNQRKDI